MGQKVFDTKKLGFGLMRLPKNGDEIDIEQTKQMVDMFMEAGFTYFDTAWAYTGSEEAIRKALVERYPRDSFTLATKMAAWIKCETREDAIAQFNLSLERSGAGYFDYYLLHNLGEHRTHVFEDFDLWNWALEQKAAGKIRHLGFSFHSNAEELEEILTQHPEAEFVQLQINYADWEDHAIQSRKVYEVAQKHGKPVIVMEPVKGGGIAAQGRCGCAGSAREDPAHPVHILRLLRQGLPDGDRHLRHLHGDERRDAVPRPRGGQRPAELAGRRARAQNRGRMHQVRCLRGGLSAAHQHPGAA